MRLGRWLLLPVVPVVLAAGAGAGWGVVAAWVVGLAVVGWLVVDDAERSEVAHLVALITFAALTLAGAALAALGHAVGLAPWAGVALFVAPAVARRLVVAKRRPRLPVDEEARLRAAPVGAVVVAAGESRSPGLVAALLLARPGGREALLAAARGGTTAERRGAGELAVALRAGQRALALEVAGELLRSAEVDGATKRRALVAVRDAADGPLVEVLRGLGRDDPALRAAALEVRARSGDPTALDDWLADAALDARATAGGFALALGRRAQVTPRVLALRDASAEGGVVGARAQALLEAFEALGGA